MEAFDLSKLENEDEERALEGLVNAFGSVFSLKEVASAYYQAGRNANLAGVILYDLQGSTSSSTNYSLSNFNMMSEESLDLSNGSTSQSYPADGNSKAFKQKQHPASLCMYDLQGSSSSSRNYTSNADVKSEESYGSTSQSYPADENSKVFQQKRHPSSLGTVSSVLGKDYFRSIPSARDSCITTKPLKLESKEFPVSEIWREETKSDSAKHYGMDKDIEDFLFKMLGDGFQLDRDAIQDILVHCGHDLEKSMEKLLDISAESLDKRNSQLGESTEKCADTCLKSESLSCPKKLIHTNNSGSDDNRILNTVGKKLRKQQKGKTDLEKEILVALFSASETPEECPVPIKTVKISRAAGEVVVAPPSDPVAEYKFDFGYSQQENEDRIREEESYQVLRRAVEENRITMKEYYRAAVNAFTKGDHVRANKLLEQGQLFHKKAREADEESAHMTFGSSDVETQHIVSLDLHDHGAKEAIRLLKFHLSKLSGIASIKYLKVIMEMDGEDTTKGARKQRIMKLLEKESIKWIEEGNPGTILICLDKINPKRLSFATKLTLQ